MEPRDAARRIYETVGRDTLLHWNYQQLNNYIRGGIEEWGLTPMQIPQVANIVRQMVEANISMKGGR